MPYETPMPAYFPANEPAKMQEVFAGLPLERIGALRDVLMIFSEAEKLPLNRQWLLPTMDSAPAVAEPKDDKGKKDKSKKGGGS
jgi:hypothetical protein